ncbi:uncharacterized protein C5orf47 homolog [Phodopus roborovskii]|uniref:4930524B15Rik protein n=1 Tax=Phodopus roborovskii TaxID=109678 RepID=A0AAU9Z3X8_PHORO|nr:uncharacterized protein C5orf47 homolog [Phodopus roborovskii]CAH6786550.1 4930524B15Rik [Phodopus roborovskii]
MVPAGSRQRQDRPGLVYVTRFASHPCGVWQLRGPRGLRHQGPGLGARFAAEQATPKSQSPGGQLPTGSHARVAATPGYSIALQLRRSRAPSGPEQAARAGLTPKNAAKEFDFPIPLNEASKIMKERKKVLVWKKVQKVISKMIAENEKYRHRLKCQNLSSEIRVNTK